MNGKEPLLETSYGNPAYPGAGGASLSDGIPKGERASGLVTYAFRQKGSDIPLVALWDASDHPTNENAVRRVSLDVRGAPLAEPVLVDLVTGAVYRLPGRMTIGSFGKNRIYEDVPFYDAPVVLTERKLALAGAR